MEHRLIQYSNKAEGPLQTFEACLEMNIQLVNHTHFAYKKHALKLPNGLLVFMAELGYESILHKMAPVNAAAAWDGFIGNIIRAVREGGKQFKQKDIFNRLDRMRSYGNIAEPLAQISVRLRM